ncbi:PilW family protein [Methylocaldum sp. MU1018]
MKTVIIKHPISSAAGQRGISLVEIMVALTLSLLLTGGALTVYLGSRQSYRANDAMARLQENARYAFEILGRDLRMAGYRGCAGEAATVTNTLNDSKDFLWNFDQPIYGYEAVSPSQWNQSPDNAITNPLGGRDIVVARGTFGNGTRVLQQPGNTDDPGLPGSADIKVTQGSGLTIGDIVLVTDCLAAAVFQVTNQNIAGGFDNVVHNTGGTLIPGNATKQLGKSYEGGELQRISTKIYYIRNNPAGQPALYRKEGAGNAEEVVEGVQDMQILYGVDDAATCGAGQADDFSADCYQTAQWVNDNGLWNNVVAVRVALLLRSVENGVVNEPQTYRFNGNTVTATDLRLYRPFETAFTLRNRVN